MKLIIFLTGIILFLFTGCFDQDVKEEDMGDYQKLEWLQGIWEGEQGDGQLYESWRQKNFRIMEGISYTTIDARRVYTQDMRIEQSNNKIYYILKKDKEGNELKLELSEVNDSTAEFTNPEEGFPQKIIYTRQKKERMNVALLGEDDEENKTELKYRRTEDFSQGTQDSPNL